jgi:membrane protease YdiL (CAAX protease family)
MNEHVSKNFDRNLFRQDVRRDMRNVVLFSVFSLIANLIAASVVEAIGIFAKKDFIDGLLRGDYSTADILDSNLLSLATLVGAVLGSLVFLIYRGKRFFTDVALPAAERMKPTTLVVLVVATQGIQFAYSAIFALLEQLLSPLGISLVDDYTSNMEILLNPIGIIYIVLVGPIVEEFIFRGAVMGALRKYGDNFAILFSSLIFGIYHMIFMQIIFAVAVSFLLGYVACRWSLRYSILLHILVNGLSVLIMESGAVGSTIASLALIICCIATIIIVIVLRKSFVARIRAGKPNYASTFRNGFSSIFFWIYAIIFVGLGILATVSDTLL